MSLVSAFQPGPDGVNSTNTANLAITASAQTLTCDVTANAGRYVHYRFVNSGTQEIFFRMGNAANPPGTAVAGTNQSMLAGTVEVFSGPPGLVISVIAAGTGSTLRVTAGEGL